MQRRNYLSVFGTALLSGCTSTISTGDQSDEDRKSKNGESYRAVGDSYRTKNGVELTVNQIEIANKVEYTNVGTVVHDEGTVLVLVRITATNKSEQVQPLPPANSISVLAGDSQYDLVRDDFISEFGSPTKPVMGAQYTGQKNAHPEVSSEGWILFEIPRSISDVTVAWDASTYQYESSEQAYWETTINPDSLPSLRLKEVKAPDSTRIGQSTDIAIVVENTGGSTGTFSTTYTVTTPSNHDQEHTVELDVPAGETAEKVIEILPRRVGEISVSISNPERGVAVPIKPALQDVGESFSLPNSARITISNLVLTDSFAYESYDGSTTITADSGMQFLFAKFKAENPTDERHPVPNKNGITASVDGNAYSIAETDKLVTRDFTSPVQGGEYSRYSASLRTGDSIEEWVLFQIPADATKTEVLIRTEWTVDFTNTIEVHWSQTE